MASEDNISASGQFTCTSCDTKYTVSITAENETYVRSVAGLIGNCKKTDCPSWYIVTNSAFSEDAIGKGLDRLIRDLPEEKRETSSVPHTTQSQSLVKTLLDERRLVTASSDPRSSSLPIATRVGKNREKRLGKSTVKQFQSSIRVDVKTDAFGTDVLTVVPTLIGWNERDLQTDSDKQTGPVQVLELRWPTQKGEASLEAVESPAGSIAGSVSVQVEANGDHFDFRLPAELSLGFEVGRKQSGSFQASLQRPTPGGLDEASSLTFACRSCSKSHRVTYNASDASIIRSIGGSVVQCLGCHTDAVLISPEFNANYIRAGLASMSSQADGRYPLLQPFAHSQRYISVHPRPSGRPHVICLLRGARVRPTPLPATLTDLSSIVEQLVGAGRLSRPDPDSLASGTQFLPIAGPVNPKWPQWFNHSFSGLNKVVSISVYSDSAADHQVLIPMPVYIDWTDPHLGGMLPDRESNAAVEPAELEADHVFTVPEEPPLALVGLTSHLDTSDTSIADAVGMLNMNGMGGLVDPGVGDSVDASTESTSSEGTRAAIANRFTWLRHGFKDLRKARE